MFRNNMFEKQSMTLTGLAVILLSFILEPQDAETVVDKLVLIADAVMALVGIGLTYWGRYRQGDITPLGLKK